MKRENNIWLLWIFFSALFILQSIGCKKSSDIKIEQTFIDGAIYKFKVEANNLFLNDTLYSRTEYFFDVKLTVKNGSEGLECSWKYVKCYIPNIDMDIVSDEVKKRIGINEGLTVNFLIDEKGKYKGITNISECRRFIKKKRLDLYNSAPEQWQGNLIDEFHYLSLLDDNELATVLFPEIVLHFECFGNKYDPNHSDTINSFTPSPFDERTLSSTTILKVENISDEIAYISETTTLSTEDNKTIRDKKSSIIKPILIEKIVRLNYDLGYKVLKESFCKLTVLENGIEKRISIAVVSQNDWAIKTIK